MSTPTSKRKIFFSISAILVVISIIFLFVKGLNLGIDFTGGTTFQFELKDTKYSPAVEKEIKDLVKKHTGNSESVVQRVNGTGSDEVSVRTTRLDNTQSDNLKKALIEKYKFDAKTLRFETVSGTVSGRLIGESLQAIGLAVILMLLYIAWRFDFKSGTSAVLALVHDVLIMLGFYAIFGFNVSTSFIAAILTIVGYSINATIIIFDRIRENNRTMRQATPDQIADKAIRDSYLRAINSSLTTLFTIGVLYVMGVDSIKEFALPIIVGIVAGTYSSLFIAGPFWAWWNNGSVKKAKAGKRIKKQ